MSIIPQERKIETDLKVMVCNKVMIKETRKGFE